MPNLSPSYDPTTLTHDSSSLSTHHSNLTNLLTIIIQTSPIPSHPSTSLLEALFRSFDRHVDGIRECRIIIIADGYDEVNNDSSSIISPSSKSVTKKNEAYKRGTISRDAAKRYREHLCLLQSRINSPPFSTPNNAEEIHPNTELMILPKRHGSARAIVAGFKRVTTPFVIVAQHDNLFVRDVPLRHIMSALSSNPALSFVKCLHFLSTATLNYTAKVARRYDVEIEPRCVDGLNGVLVPLVFWYGRTHIARREYYEDFILQRDIRVGDHLEELWGERQLKDVKRRGMAEAHGLYGNYVLDQGEEVLYHLSGRKMMAMDITTKTTKKGEDKAPTIVSTTDPSSSPMTTISMHMNVSDTGSYTTARSRRAVVPGLAHLPGSSLAAVTGEEFSEGRQRQRRFRQRCFHCGVKGHSFKFCPDMTSNLPTETIDLS